MAYETIHPQDAIDYNIEEIVSLLEKMKKAWMGTMLSESEKEWYLLRFKPRKRSGYCSSNKRYEEMQQQTFVRVDCVTLRGCIVLMKECLNRLEEK